MTSKKAISIKAVGDIFLANQPSQLDRGIIRTIRTKGENYILRGVKEYLAGGDIVMGNLESPVSKSVNINSRIFRVELPSLKSLGGFGFNVLSVANNHIMEHGIKGFTETISNLRKCGIIPIGQRNKFEIIKVRNKSVGLFAMSQVDDGHKDVPYMTDDFRKIKFVLNKVRKECDFVVVSIHWGYEFMDHPSHEQVIFAHKLIDSGVDVIIGHHPHVLQNIEYYHKGLIVYSLGNFVFDLDWWPKSFESSIISIKLDSRRIHYSLAPICSNKERQLCIVKKTDPMYGSIMKILNSTPQYNKNYQFDYANIKRSQKRLHRIFFLRNIMNRSPLDFYFLILGKIRKMV